MPSRALASPSQIFPVCLRRTVESDTLLVTGWARSVRGIEQDHLGHTSIQCQAGSTHGRCPRVESPSVAPCGANTMARMAEPRSVSAPSSRLVEIISAIQVPGAPPVVPPRPTWVDPDSTYGIPIGELLDHSSVSSLPGVDPGMDPPYSDTPYKNPSRDAPRIGCPQCGATYGFLLIGGWDSRPVVRCPDQHEWHISEDSEVELSWFRCSLIQAGPIIRTAEN
jgi:hypothetical protein